MKTIALLALALLACPVLKAEEPSKAVCLRLGMKHADALIQLKGVGAKPFECSYRYFHLSGAPPAPYFTYTWFTLPTGMSIEIHGDKKQQNDDLLVKSLRVCNSTMLFCCKGETWYHVDSISLLDEEPGLGKPTAWVDGGKKAHDVTAYLFKGMPFTDAQKMLEKAGVKPLPSDDAWLGQMPEGGRWMRYAIKCHNDDCKIIINIGSANPRADNVIRTLLIEAAKPQEDDHKEARYKVECEFLDLKEPLKKGWSRAFGESWSWKPKENGQADNLKASGQRR